MVHFEYAHAYGVEDLKRIVKILRSPEGCPWDREQTHESIRSNFLEETHEAIEAINNGDVPALREELGDVLMQVTLHTQIATELGEFTFDDVVDEVCRKLIVRHPHVFGNVQADTSEQVLANWEVIKSEEKERVTVTDKLRAIPPMLPALMQNTISVSCASDCSRRGSAAEELIRYS